MSNSKAPTATNQELTQGQKDVINGMTDDQLRTIHGELSATEQTWGMSPLLFFVATHPVLPAITPSNLCAYIEVKLASKQSD